MKYCQNSYKCPWGSATDPGTCAYSADIDENDECPMVWQDIEYNMDRLISGNQPRE
jgi:hypothetical protein